MFVRMRRGGTGAEGGAAAAYEPTCYQVAQWKTLRARPAQARLDQAMSALPASNPAHAFLRYGNSRLFVHRSALTETDFAVLDEIHSIFCTKADSFPLARLRELEERLRAGATMTADGWDRPSPRDEPGWTNPYDPPVDEPVEEEPYVGESTGGGEEFWEAYDPAPPSDPAHPPLQEMFDRLGVDRDATDDEIKRAYRMLARQLHPDVNPDPEVQERFKEVARAYEILSDPQKRQDYEFRYGS